MTMPVLPALMNPGDKSQAPSLADVLDQLDESQVAELVATAEAAGFGEDSPAEEAAESDEEAAAEGDLDTEPSEEDVNAVAGQGFEEMSSWVTSSVEGLGAQVDAISASVDAASEGEETGAEPDEAQAALEQAQELQATVEELQGEYEAAEKAEDAHAAGVACLKIEKAVRKMALLAQLAATAAETTDSVEPAGVADEPAVKLWAERTKQPMGPLGSPPAA